MWFAITDLLLRMRSAGLGHDAVIEIMIALLGVMMGAMSILAVLVSLVFAGLGFFGYKAIEEKSITAAEEAAIKVATETATKAYQDQWLAEQAVDLSASQPPTRRKKVAPTIATTPARKTTDAGLSRARKAK